MKKLRMQADELKVDSFRTEDPRAPRPGTVRAHGDGCTWFDSCFCHTAYAVCGTGPETIHSCDYTFDERCERTAVDCPNTNYDVCGTRAITPAC